MNIALIKSGKVDNIIVSDLPFAQALQGYDTAVDVTGAGVGLGWSWDGKKFSAPASQTDPTPGPEIRLSYLEFFLGRFTETELEALQGATEPIIADNRRLRLAMKFMEKAEYISLQDPRTEQFLNELTAAGLLAAGRTAQILTA